MSLLLLFHGSSAAPVSDEEYYRRYLNDVTTRDSYVAIALPVAPPQDTFEGYALETDVTFGYLLEDSSGILLLENDPEDDYFRRYLNDVINRDNT